MNEKIIVPVLGESITEATVAKWLKKEGDSVEADEAIVELETDKVNLEVPSPIEGVLSQINSKDGDTVEVGALLGTISKNGFRPAEKKIIKKTEPKKIENNVVNLDAERKEPKFFESKDKDIDTKKSNPLILTNEVKKENKNIPLKKINETLSPAVRKIVVENKIDLKKVSGSGTVSYTHLTLPTTPYV